MGSEGFHLVNLGAKRMQGKLLRCRFILTVKSRLIKIRAPVIIMSTGKNAPVRAGLDVFHTLLQPIVNGEGAFFTTFIDRNRQNP